MKKFSIILVLCVCLLALTSVAMAQTVNYSRVTSPASIKVYYADVWSDKGYIDLSSVVPAGATVNWVQLVSYTVSSSAGNYGNIYVYMFNANSTKSTPLVLNEINNDFQGLPANQKFYIQFFTDYVQFSGNPVYLQRPTVVISVTQ